VEDRNEQLRGDVFEVLRTFRNETRLFDAVIVDPPKLVRSASGVNRGARAYKDVNRLAFGVTRPGGYVATFSCSGLVSADLFQKIVFSASVEAGREVQIIERFGPPDDHPVLLTFPEGDYLKGLGCRVW
jgi:23S rRNA (cytosine1962-C5)-methyltransferase